MSEILDGRERIKAQGRYGYFNLTLSGPFDVAVLKWKVYKTSTKIKDIFSIRASFEINPNFKQSFHN